MEDNNFHPMITRSKKAELKLNLDLEIDKSTDTEVDEQGNLAGLIDYSCDEDFDNDMFQKELARLRGGKYTPSPKKKIKKKKKDNKLQELLASYIFMNMISGVPITPRKKLKRKKKVIGDIIDEELKTEEDENMTMVIKDIEEEEEEEIVNIEGDNSEDGTNSFSEDEEDLDYEDIEEINESSSESSIGSDYGEYDEYDEEFLELVDSDMDENEDINYFQKLDDNKKIDHINSLKEIQKITSSNIPMRFKILNSNMDMRTKSIAIENINKLNEMDVSTGEHCKMDKWINGLIKIPFGKYINLPITNDNKMEEKRDYLHNTKNILDKAIYGHKDAKMHILQVIGKWIRNPLAQGNVLAIQGPMGNGKTTLVKEGIAKAIDRPFAFIALGGASDSAFFDGHSYTYEGSHWGRIIDILIESKCMNPIIYFDELDKVSETYKGEEIINLLTHLTDPSQNSLFQDNYFPGIHLDLSKALFIFSFNDETKINRILKDRMYVINTKGFKPEDKISICREYILPELLNTYMFDQNEILFPDESIHEIIEKYTLKEEGVRNLKRCLETIISKINIYYLSYKEDEKGEDLCMTFKIKDFKLPITVTTELIDELINKNIDLDKAPEHMYM
tara:strand:- start:1437 stop:3293 length:1857 start_codon:yes stop_codon:yes gene_type:complete